MRRILSWGSTKPSNLPVISVFFGFIRLLIIDIISWPPYKEKTGALMEKTENSISLICPVIILGAGQAILHSVQFLLLHQNLFIFPPFRV